VPDNPIPEADHAFLELGNLLTDVSQFRDPPASHRARKEALEKAANKAAEIVGSPTVGGWVVAILGSGD
jgi:hypothetical protein